MATRSKVSHPHSRSKSAVILYRLRLYRFDDPLFVELAIPRKVVPFRRRWSVR